MIQQRSLVSYILLSIITCGIYAIYFWCMYTDDVNKVCQGDGKESPHYIVVWLLSIVTFGIYGIWWFYTQGNRLQAIAPKYNLNFQENGTTVIMWFIFGAVICGIGPFVAMNILFKNMNSIANVYNAK